MPQALLDVVEMKKTDPNVYGRVLTLPELPGILPLSKTSVRRDFRGIAGREPQQMSQDDDDENGPQSQQPSEFPQPQIKCDEVGLTAPPSPQAAPTKDEKPATVSSLETAVFRDGESGKCSTSVTSPPKRYVKQPGSVLQLGTTFRYILFLASRSNEYGSASTV
eukprot:gb/GECG01015782.1/.p1 GENE.gb/GECG01015782.1/~~gb/GECG01015782.1/.p1  ORF type:complete len:164 (+),score=24.84 gb/GECG01015782.1/:1-492(+)